MDYETINVLELVQCIPSCEEACVNDIDKLMSEDNEVFINQEIVRRVAITLKRTTMKQAESLSSHHLMWTPPLPLIWPYAISSSTLLLLQETSCF